MIIHIHFLIYLYLWIQQLWATITRKQELPDTVSVKNVAARLEFFKSHISAAFLLEAAIQDNSEQFLIHMSYVYCGGKAIYREKVFKYEYNV